MVRVAWAGALLVLLVIEAACGRDVTSIGAERSALHDASMIEDDAGIDAEVHGAVDASVYIEAEDGVVSGFAIEESAEASAGQALLAPDVLSDGMPGTARASYAFELADAGDYILWGRVYAPDVDANRFWLQLDGGEPFLWRISTGEVWYWDDVHDDAQYSTPLVFAFNAGVHELVIANAGPQARLDRLYLTANGDTPPGNDTPCRPPHTVELGGECVPSCGLLMGTRCGAVDCMGQTPLPAYDCDICCRVE